MNEDRVTDQEVEKMVAKFNAIVRSEVERILQPQVIITYKVLYE